MTMPLFIDRETALRAVEASMSGDHHLLVVAQRSEDIEDPTAEDIYYVGTECAVDRVLRMPDGTSSVLVHGLRRVRIDAWLQYAPYGRVQGTAFDEPIVLTNQSVALMRSTLGALETCCKLSTQLNEDVYIQALNVDRPGGLADFIVGVLELEMARRQWVLETLDPLERLREACELVHRELSVLGLQHEIELIMQREVDRGQREYLLREQLKAIQRELGEHELGQGDISALRERIKAAGMPTEAHERAQHELERLQALPALAPEAGVVRTYLDWLVALPWQAATKDQLDLAHVAAVLDAHHAGLQQIKDRILEFIAVRKLAPEGRTPILCLVGPPGVGKTSLGRSIAEALGRRFVRISLGGVRDEAEIRGHRRTYVGALPGRILQSMKTAGTMNPVMVLDEIDKLAADYHGDPAAALLEVLDPEQNVGFSDHYLELPYDLSRVLFILTANVAHTIPAPLRDRMEVIEIAGYTEEEKLAIARQFLLPRLLRETGLGPARVEIDDEAVRHIIRDYTFEAGVRNLEREVGAILRRIARRVAEGRRHKAHVTAQKLRAYLGPQKHYPADAEECDEVGVATGLAWTAAGGDLTTVEVLAVPGHGAINLTGQLGDVMKESAQAALTFTRARAASLGLAGDFHERCDLHIQLPAGGIPKDGPSAGVTMAVAIISALTGRRVRRDVALTGELTLRGRVLPVGGVKEKVLAAYRAGITTVVLPKRNSRDLDDVPDEVRDGLTLVGVENMDAVLDLALASAPLAPVHLEATRSRSGPVEPRTERQTATRQDPLAAASRSAQSRARRHSTPAD
jgi:ATP-dependent Lon protease